MVLHQLRHGKAVFLHDLVERVNRTISSNASDVLPKASFFMLELVKRGTADSYRLFCGQSKKEVFRNILKADWQLVHLILLP